jgi:hypothetical protein
VSFFDEVVAETHTNGPSCSLPAILDSLDPALAAEIETAIYGEKYQIAAVVRAGAKHGLTKGIVSRHRHHECRTCRS